MEQHEPCQIIAGGDGKRGSFVAYILPAI